MSETDSGFLAALEEAKKGAEEGGVPIGACLVGKDGKMIGAGHNMRVQKGSATLHVSVLLSHLWYALMSTGRNVGSREFWKIAC